MKTRLTFIAFLIIGFTRTHAQDQPNILMIVIDDLNNFVGVMEGHPQAYTPNIDRLANQGVLFNNAHSNAPICMASRASFMTGVHPITSKLWGFGNWLKDDRLMNTKTLPEYFKENGYQTYQTGKVFHNNKKGSFDDDGIVADYGPMAYNGNKSTIHPSNPSEMLELGPLDATFAPLSDVPNVKPNNDFPGYKGWYNTHWETKGPFKYNNSEDRDLLTDEKSAKWAINKIQYLEKKDTNKPFFLSVGFIRPHTPLVVPKKYYDIFPLEKVEIPLIKENDKSDTKLDSNSNKETRGSKAFRALTESNLYSNEEEALRAYTQAYLASIAFADAMIGEVIDALEKSAFNKNTVVILFSDHGYNIGQKDYLFKYALWEDTTKVPFIIKDPQQPKSAGKIINHPISLIDIYPTLKDIANLKGSTKFNNSGYDLSGHSLTPFLKTDEIWNGPNIALSVITSWKSKKPSEQHISVRSKNIRYTLYSNGDEELYDHTNDKHEWNNVADKKEYKNLKFELKKELSNQLKLLQ